MKQSKKSEASITLRLPRKLLARLDAYVEREERTRGATVRLAIKRFLDSQLDSQKAEK